MPPQMPPQDPQLTPQGAPVDDPNAPVSEEEKQALQNIIAEVQSKLKTLQAQSFAVDNQGEQLRGEMLKKVFSELEAAGIDFSSQESVSKFLADLQQKNPDIAKAFETAMDILLGLPEGTPLDGSATDPASSGQPPQDMSHPGGGGGGGAPVDPGAALGLPPQGGNPQNMNIQNPNENLLKG